MIKFKKSYIKVQALMNFDSEVNIMISAYVAVFALRVYPTDVGTQKIDKSTLLIYAMMLAKL